MDVTVSCIGEIASTCRNRACQEPYDAQIRRRPYINPKVREAHASAADRVSPTVAHQSAEDIQLGWNA